MKRRTKFAVAATVAAALAGGTAVAVAGGGDDSEEPIRGRALARASAAALEHTGGGRVTDSEVGDEDALYEVEVTLDDGRQVDVHLDNNFKVVGDEADADTGEDEQDAD